MHNVGFQEIVMSNIRVLKMEATRSSEMLVPMYQTNSVTFQKTTSHLTPS
jgi:hypothetical protein